ncbi:MAG: PTS sugar transporter subunit IIA [Acidobacteriota bacterium]|nr:PTS sugar transporter subunit IIA [Blastocatellia bacterium]MDW8238511.1 PTS sugar transporter subunit IIA [Acidobacteriota bacterium]
MIGGVLVTHGQLARELVHAAETIVGEVQQITAVSIGWHDDVETARQAIKAAIDQVNSGSGVLVLTDVLGGTPTNIAASFMGIEPIEIVTGVNLPMVIRLASQRGDEDLMTLAQQVRDQGKQDIYLASEILTPKA